MTSAHWLNRLTEEWSVTIRPETQGSIAVVLPKQRYCVVVLSPGTREADLVSGAPCAAGDRQLSNQPEATITGPTSQQQAANNPATGAPTINNGTAQVGETLTALTSGISDADGLVSATFTYQWLADDTEISDATGSSYTVTDGDVGQPIRVRVSFTDDAGNAETLTSTATAAVVRPPLTASAQNVPQSHDGQNAFTFELRFSEEPDLSYTTVRDHAFTVIGGSVTYVRRLEPGRNIGWKIHVTPNGNGDVTLSLRSTTDCSAQGAICTEDGGKLSGGLLASIPGPNTPG